MQIYLPHKHSNITHPFLSGISLNATLATKCKFKTCVTAFTNKPAFFLITLEFVASIQLLNANKYFFSDSLPSHHKFWLVSSKQAGREENYLIQFYVKRKLIKFSV